MPSSNQALCSILVLLLMFPPSIQKALANPASTPNRSAGYAKTGRAVAGMENFEAQLTALLQSWAVPGATVAIAQGGRLVYARGFGWSDIENKEPIQPDTLIRIASVSKAITAVATLKLVEEGKLRLDEHAFEILNELQPCTVGSKGVDPRLFQITVRNLLQMTAGWNRTHTGDPMFAPLVHYASYDCSPTLRADSVAIIRYWMGKQLDFDPGTSYSYSNLCYAVLEQIIRKRSGVRYSEFVKQKVLLPCGITDMRLGRTLHLAPRETRYYPFPGQEQANSYFPNIKGYVDLQYGGDFALEALAGAAGWIGSSVDLVRFITTVCGEQKEKTLISSQTLKTMLSCPDIPYWEHHNEYFGMGFEVTPVTSRNGTGYILSRVGSFPGSMAFVVHMDNGISWAFETNSRPYDQYRFLNEARSLISDSINRQKNWPSWDLFADYK